MRATVMYGAGDVRIENVPNAKLIELNDQVDQGYREKYGRYASYVAPMIAPPERATTLRLVPQDPDGES